MRVKRRHIPEFDAHLFVCSTMSSQVAEAVLAAQVVVEDYVAVAAREVAHYAALRPHVVVSAFLVAVVVVRAQDCTSVCKIHLRHENEESQSVVQPSDQEHPSAFARRQILVEQKQIVAEVEVGFLRV